MRRHNDSVGQESHRKKLVITKVEVVEWKNEGKIVKTIEAEPELRHFQGHWHSRESIDLFHTTTMKYQLRIFHKDGCDIHSYDPEGLTKPLSKKYVGCHEILDPERFNRLLGISK